MAVFVVKRARWHGKKQLLITLTEGELGIFRDDYVVIKKLELKED